MIRRILFGLVGLVLFVGLVFGLIALGRAVFPPREVAQSPVCDEEPASAVEENTSSCVVRAEYGAKIPVGTVTWDAETRVWELKDFICEGPYCYDYSNCENPEMTMARQPYRLGYELSPVNGQMFQICKDYLGSCSRQ